MAEQAHAEQAQVDDGGRPNGKGEPRDMNDFQERKRPLIVVQRVGGRIVSEHVSSKWRTFYNTVLRRQPPVIFWLFWPQLHYESEMAKDSRPATIFPERG